MKILQIVRQYAPSVGGMEAHVRDLTEHLCSAGISSDVLTLNRIFSDTSLQLPRHEIIGCCNVYRIPYIGFRRYPVALSVLNYLHDYDLIHVHGIDFFADILALTKAIHRKPLVISTHGGFFHTDFASGMKEVYFETITRRTLGNFEKVICVSQQDLDLFSRITANTVLINNGIDIQRCRSIPRSIEPYLLLSIGRLSKNKRHDRLIRAFAEVRKIIPRARLVIVGSDWDNILTDLMALASELGVTDEVNFLGEVPQEELNALMAKAHLFVSSSEYEGFGLTVAETMAAGIVPVLQNMKAFERMTDNGRYGYLTDFAESNEAARTICTALGRSKEENDRESEQVRISIDKYSWKFVINDFIKTYERALSKSLV